MTMKILLSCTACNHDHYVDATPATDMDIIVEHLNEQVFVYTCHETGIECVFSIPYEEE